MRAAPLCVFVKNVKGIQLCTFKNVRIRFVMHGKQRKSLVIPMCLPLRYAGWIYDHQCTKRTIIQGRPLETLGITIHMRNFDSRRGRGRGKHAKFLFKVIVILHHYMTSLCRQYREQQKLPSTGLELPSVLHS